jgi:UDPglucose 6-dehydrogenase
MANKVPVIGSNAGEIPNVIKDSGFIFKQKNIKSLLASLITLIQNEALRLELSEKGYKRVLNNYTHEVIAKKTYNFWVNINTQKSLDNFLGKYQEGEVMKKIAVVGAGYVGLVTGVCLATQKEYLVTIIENNEDKINKLLSGKVPFYEPGLDILLTKGIEQGNLIFVNNIKTALENNPEIIFSCVGTPSLPDGSADLSYVWNVSTEIGKNLNNYCIIVNKSTVPVGTGKKVQALILHQLNSRNIKIDFDVASNPEFLKEGDALNDFLKPDRIVIGTQSEKTKYILSQLYRPFVHNDNQFVFMNIESAELTKYASNAMLATKISFINQIALLADKVGANIEHIKQGMSKDIRIGPHFLNAGIGYGGSCFPKDVQALISMGSEYNQPMTLVSEVENINNSQRFWFSNKIINYYGSQISHKNLGIWGLAFKPETDDIRCAPSIDTLVSLLEKGANIYAYDPVASNNIKEIFGARIKYAQSAQEILKICDALAILTEWKEFKNFTPEYFTTLKDKLVFDGRNCFDPVLMFNAGINYMCIGNNIITHKTYTGVTTTKETHTIHPPKNPPIEPIPQ